MMVGNRRDLPEGVHHDADRGTYYCKWRTSTGKQAKKRGFSSPREASKHRRQQLAAADRNEDLRPPRERGTFAAYAEAWIIERKGYVAPGTWSDYEIHVRLRLVPHFGAMRLEAIDRADIGRYVADLEGTLKPKTINNSLIVLSAMLEDAVADRLVPFNPAKGRPGARSRSVKLRVESREMDYLRLYEIPGYLDGCSNEYRPMAELLVHTGLRVSELAALRVDDLHLDEGFVLVKRQHQHDEDVLTKSQKARRVEIGDRLAGVLRDHLAREGEHRKLDGRAHVFLRPSGGRQGQPYDRFRLRDLHKQAAKAIDRAGLRAHDLRHTAAASWLACGLPLIYVQRQLGHSDLMVTERNYGHLEASFLESAALRAEKAIWGELEPTPA